jgi:beta-glucosidase-like glycosyl hydrolase
MKKIYIFSLLSLLFFFSFPIASDNSWAERTLKTLSLREKIGQLFVVATCAELHEQEEAVAVALLKSPYNLDHSYIEKLIKEYHIGGIIFLYKATPEKQIEQINYFQRISSLPLLIVQDCEWGLAMRLYNTIKFPKNMTLGAIRDCSLIYQLGAEIGRQCKAIGVHINCAPVVDINTNPENPIIHDRSFGEDKELVARQSSLLMDGLHNAGILACAKHFPGHGDTYVDSHLDTPVLLQSKEQLFDVELYPFKKLIEKGVACIMIGHLKVPACDDNRNPATLSRKIVTDLLQHQLGFNGLVMTDGMGMRGITKHYKSGSAELKALLAGNDIILCPVDVPKAAALIEEAIEKGILKEEELDQHVLKILRAKEYFNLDRDRYIDAEKALPYLHSPEAYALKKKLYQQAITLVKNNNTLLPLQETDLEKTALIHVGGDIPSTFEKEFEKVLTYYLPSHPEKKAIELVHKKMQSKEIVIIAFSGMNKSAEEHFGIDKKIMQCIKVLKREGKKIIIVLFGTPYSLALFDQEEPIEDALIVGYEDDPDAQSAVAQIIKGDLHPRGRLPVTGSEYFPCGCGLGFDDDN